jgi:hypothetical protein
MWKNIVRYRVNHFNSIQLMQTQAERFLNPHGYHLSPEAKKRLRWLYLLFYECEGNVTKAAHKIGISREWLSKLKSKFERHNRHPRSLEPKSKAPHQTSVRKRIPQEIEDKILEIRDKYGWGKEKIQARLKNHHRMKTGASTVNRYLHKNLKINPQISKRHKKAWWEKKQRESLKEKEQINLEIKYRPPTQLKDYQPGALIEKDMKLIPARSKIPLKIDHKFHLKDHFNYQHTFIDTFTRMKAMELIEEPDSLKARQAYRQAKKRFPFEIGSMNTDSGGENGKYFRKELQKDEVIQFYSRTGTPTDNPRVERSHLTDEAEFYARGWNNRPYQEQKRGLRDWEYIYNQIRPHQALGYLTPLEFYQLWQENPNQAYKIRDQYKKYLARQRKRQASARRLKRKEQVEKLMQFIEAKLERNKDKKVDLQPYKLELTRCELCSWT